MYGDPHPMSKGMYISFLGFLIFSQGSIPLTFKIIYYHFLYLFSFCSYLCGIQRHFLNFSKIFIILNNLFSRVTKGICSRHIKKVPTTVFLRKNVKNYSGIGFHWFIIVARVVRHPCISSLSNNHTRCIQ